MCKNNIQKKIVIIFIYIVYKMNNLIFIKFQLKIIHMVHGYALNLQKMDKLKV